MSYRVKCTHKGCSMNAVYDDWIEADHVMRTHEVKAGHIASLSKVTDEQ